MKGIIGSVLYTEPKQPLKQTPLQELIEWIGSDEFERFNGVVSATDIIKNKARSLLHKERQGLVDAFNKGGNDVEQYWVGEKTLYKENREIYFNNTYQP